MADGARAGGHQHGGAFLGAREQNPLIAGIGRDAETGAGFHGDIGRQAHRLFRRQHDPFRGGAEGAPPLAVPNPNPLADTRRGNAFAHGVDLARAVAVWNDAREGDLARQAGPALDVGRIDAGGAQAHAHLTRPRLRRLHVGDAQHLACGSVRFVIGSAHQEPRVRFPIRPGLTSSMSALPSISINAAASAPVIHACTPSFCSSS